PRNAASGISQRLDSKYSQYCTLFAVDLFPNNNDLTTESQKIDLLKKYGFTPVESFLCSDLSKVEKIYQDFLSHKRNSYPYEIDGLVVKINDLNLQNKLGFKNLRPKGQVAYKFPPDTTQTRVLEVNWETGPMGTITPVAKVEPISLSGAII
ncbi:DNA ligase, partial [Candidatus Shapirobacteria bacterium CG10_big_fil_rev_8_21_14_0_10_36_6]